MIEKGAWQGASRARFRIICGLGGNCGSKSTNLISNINGNRRRPRLVTRGFVWVRGRIMPQFLFVDAQKRQTKIHIKLILPRKEEKRLCSDPKSKQ